MFPTVHANEYGITPVAGSTAAFAASGSLRGERRMILSPAKNVTVPSTGGGMPLDGGAI